MRVFVTNVRGCDSECTQAAALRRNPFGQVSPAAGFTQEELYYFTNCWTRVEYNDENQNKRLFPSMMVPRGQANPESYRIVLLYQE